MNNKYPTFIEFPIEVITLDMIVILQRNNIYVLYSQYR